MGQEKPPIGLDRIFEQRFSRRNVLRAAALAPFALSEKDKLRENGVRSDLKDLLITREDSERAAINISDITDATDASGAILSEYVISNGILYSSHWDNKKGKYTEFKPITDIFSGLSGYTDRGVDLVALPDDRTLVAAGFYPDDNGYPKPFIAMSEDRGNNFGLIDIDPELSWGFFANAQESIVTPQYVLIEHIQPGPNQYILFNTETRGYDILKEENGKDMPFIRSVFVTPDGTTALVNGTIGVSEGNVTTIAEAHIDLKNKKLDRVVYTELPVDYSLDIHFYRDENGNLTQIYTLNHAYSPYLGDDEFHKSKLQIFDNQTKALETIPFSTFREPVKELLGDEWSEAGFTRFQRIGNMNVASGSAVNDLPDSYFTNHKALTVFWPEGSDPRDPSNLTFRYIDTEEWTKVGDAGLKKLKRGFVLEEVIAGLGLAAIPMTQDGELLGEEILFPNNGLQIQKLLTP
ncbi:MAG: hypothetical protein HY431_00850 [Candidatus Levybacteria bacterium]|nr:hypothetical protein [Candidatus Levybacteria bacterium]